MHVNSADHKNSVQKLCRISCRNLYMKSCRAIPCTCIVQNFVQKNIHEIEQKQLHKKLYAHALCIISCRKTCTKSCRKSRARAGLCRVSCMKSYRKSRARAKLWKNSCTKSCRNLRARNPAEFRVGKCAGSATEKFRTHPLCTISCRKIEQEQLQKKLLHDCCWILCKNICSKNGN